MAIDRSKLKATSLNTLKKQDKDVAKVTSKKNDRAGFVDIEDGWNKFRIYPAHPDSTSFIFPKVVHWIPQEVEVWENGQSTGKKEIKNRPIFNSKVHGGTSKDIITEYIDFVQKLVKNESKDPSEVEKLLAPLKGMKTSILPKTVWICYVDKYDKNGKKEFGRLEITDGTKNKLNELAALNEDENTVIGLDPFTDPDEGIAIIINYDPHKKTAKGQDDFKNYYILSFEEKKVNKFTTEKTPTPLTDEDLEFWLAQESLESLYTNSYKRSDFEKALSGLQIYDQQHGFGVFAHDEFLDIVQELDKLYPEENEENKDATKAFDKKKVEGDIEDDEEKEEGESKDMLTNMDRVQLKAYIKDKGYKDAIVVRTSFSDDDIRNMIRTHEETINEVANYEEPSDEESSEEPEEKVEVPTKSLASEEKADKAEIKKAVKKEKETTPETEPKVENKSADSVRAKLDAIKDRIAKK